MAEDFSFMAPAGASFGAISSSVKPEHYQLLVDRGWRRSGTYFYKPDNRHHCCPHYTIRLEASAFKAKKEQRHSINRWNEYILGQDYREKASRCCPATREDKRRRRHFFDLGERVHKSEYKNIKRPIDAKTKAPLEPAQKFEVNLEPDNYTDEKFALFKHYQKFVHKEDTKSKHGFSNFLCNGLGQKVIKSTGQDKKIGSYHQCYRLGGKLIAIGFLDLLPDCVSSIYLIYHEDVNEWEFGKLSAMREIQFAIEGGYRYYYMGYYIHSCVKMRYKGRFQPTYVLDPVTYAWDPLDSDLSQRLSARRFVSLALDRRLNVPANPEELAQYMQSAQDMKIDLLNALKVGNVEYQRAIDYVRENPDEDAELPDGVFDAGMPGAMSLEELHEQTDLGKWLVQIGDQITMMENLVAWEEGDFSDADSIKGLVAQFAACLGPDLMEVVVLKFG